MMPVPPDAKSVSDHCVGRSSSPMETTPIHCYTNY
uniref:Uncharacterized protein n=1 Tax=Anguilla anguilla TaxID=7936 RepID=A0A0E9V3U7_ANGAN